MAMPWHLGPFPATSKAPGRTTVHAPAEQTGAIDVGFMLGHDQGNLAVLGPSR